MEAFTQLCVILVLVSVIKVSKQQEYTSPCPEVFTFEQEGRKWFGRVEVPSDKVINDLELEVVMFLKRPLPSEYQGHIQFRDDPVRVHENVIYNRRITYIVTFPLKEEIPSLVSITFNEEKLCEGDTPQEFSTIVRLKHIRKLKSEDEDDATTTTKRPPTRKSSPPRARPTPTIRRSPKPNSVETSRKPTPTTHPSTKRGINRKPISEETTQKSRRPTSTGTMKKPNRFNLNPSNSRVRQTSKIPVTEGTTTSNNKPNQNNESLKENDSEDYYGEFFHITDMNNKQENNNRKNYHETLNEHNSNDYFDKLYAGIFTLKKQPPPSDDEINVKPNKKRPVDVPNAYKEPKDKTSEDDHSDVDANGKNDKFTQSKEHRDKHNSEESDKLKKEKSEDDLYAEYFQIDPYQKPKEDNFKENHGITSTSLKAKLIDRVVEYFDKLFDKPHSIKNDHNGGKDAVEKEPPADVQFIDYGEPAKKIESEYSDEVETKPEENFQKKNYDPLSIANDQNSKKDAVEKRPPTDFEYYDYGEPVKKIGSENSGEVEKKLDDIEKKMSKTEESSTFLVKDEYDTSLEGNSEQAYDDY